MTSVRAVEGDGEEEFAGLGVPELSAAIDAFASEIVSVGFGESDCFTAGKFPQEVNVSEIASMPIGNRIFFTLNNYTSILRTGWVYAR